MLNSFGFELLRLEHVLSSSGLNMFLSSAKCCFCDRHIDLQGVPVEFQILAHFALLVPFWAVLWTWHRKLLSFARWRQSDWHRPVRLVLFDSLGCSAALVLKAT